MKTVILYRPNTETETRVREYAHGFEMQTGKKLELVDAESPDGSQLAQLHDILQFPAILVSEDNGGYVANWNELDKWPTYSELSYHTM